MSDTLSGSIPAGPGEEAQEAAQGVPLVDPPAAALVTLSGLLVAARVARLQDRCRLHPALAELCASFFVAGFAYAVDGQVVSHVGERHCIIRESEVEVVNALWGQGKRVPL